MPEQRTPHDVRALLATLNNTLARTDTEHLRRQFETVPVEFVREFAETLSDTLDRLVWIADATVPGVQRATGEHEEIEQAIEFLRDANGSFASISEDDDEDED